MDIQLDSQIIFFFLTDPEIAFPMCTCAASNVMFNFESIYLDIGLSLFLYYSICQ